MARDVIIWQCSECEFSQPKNKFFVCPRCSRHDTAIEVVESGANSGARAKAAARAPGARQMSVSSSFITLAEVAQERADRGPRATIRLDTGISELNRVTGGGLVVGAPYMLFGSWGNGKSTLMTQVIINLLHQGRKAAIITGEESAEAWLDRFIRLGLDDQYADNLVITQDTVLDGSLTEMSRFKPDLIVVDSLQTVTVEGYEGAAGDAGQVKRATNMVCDFSRNERITLLMIGQITKDGTAAGPNLVMHAYDTPLLLEGDDRWGLRFLRAPKNRHGTTDEVGILEMTSKGLVDVPDPSTLFMAGRSHSIPGSVVCPVIEGQRPMLVEVQALVAPTNAEKPVREVVGYDKKRFNLMMMALTQHCGLRLGGFDIGLSLADGMKITDPALDLAVCVAIASAYVNVAPDDPIAACGQVSLLGEVRSVPMLEKRIKEAERLKFGNIITGVGAKTLRDAVLAATGGQLRRQSRDDEGADD